MKNLIFINGTMGVGKTTTSRELQKILPKNVFLDGDWCWDMKPFVVNKETKKMVINNIAFLLNQFISCSEYENIIFCWVMHEQKIIDEILSRINYSDCNFEIFSLVCCPDKLIDRISKYQNDETGIETTNIIWRSLERLKMYDALNTEKIDTSDLNPGQTAQIIKERINTNIRCDY